MARIEQAVFDFRFPILALLAGATLFLAYQSLQLRIDAGFEKRLPLGHPYMQTFLEYQEAFGGANRLLIAVRARDRDIFTADFFDTLRQITDAVFFLPGVNRSSVRSLFTPNVRFIEIVEGGFAGGNIIPAEFQPSPQNLELVRENILKSELVGRLVANDFSAALVSAELIEHDPATGRKLDYLDVADRLERSIRAPFINDRIDIHILGFAKAMGDIADGAAGVATFFGATFVITALLVYLLVRSITLTVLPLACSLIAVVWSFGLLRLVGFGLDPMSILLPFLIFSIGVSHGIQMISAYDAEVIVGADGLTAARLAFRRLLIAGGTALASDMLGFLTIVLISVQILQQLAIAAALGVGVIVLTNLLLLPLLLSFSRPRDRLAPGAQRMEWFYQALSGLARPKGATVSLLAGLALLTCGALESRMLQVGDLRLGVAELRPDSRYNQDSALIASRFAIGVDVLQVIIETEPNGCIDYDVMTEIDRFQWHMANMPGVQSTLSLPQVAKVIHAGWNEGSLKWRVLPRHESSLAQAVAPIDTSSGLLNADCSVMPVQIFTADHKADTINRVVDAAKNYAAADTSERHVFRLATGNVGVIAATNEVVEAAQIPILLYVYVAIIALCGLTFRSGRAVLCIVLPLGLVSVLVYALMAALDIGLTISTLPVAALAVGIGVDYGIYVYARLEGFLRQGLELAQAYRETLRVTGKAVLLTGLTLAIGVSSWAFSALQFQADMGILLTFVFLANMLGALLLLPALACLTDRLGRPRR